MKLTTGRRALAVAVLASLTAVAGVTAAPKAGRMGWLAAGADAAKADVGSNAQSLWIIGFKDAPVAAYGGEVPQYQAIPRDEDGQMVMSSPAAYSYEQYLEARQSTLMQSISSTLGRTISPISPQFQFQHAFNGFVASLTEAEAKRVAALDFVKLVEQNKNEYLDTERGPALIGAPSLWNVNPNATADTLFDDSLEEPAGIQGEGIIVGVVDSGINQDSPSFAAVDERGYKHVNPFGAGTYVGWCNGVGNVPATCNDKLIGAWDYMDALMPQISASDPNAVDGPGVEDENNHGSHTASTAAGNRRTATFLGSSIGISGVAPHANVIAYDACYSTLNAQGAPTGPCPNVATLAAINQAVADGVDVINYSIGGGTSPWTQAQSLAFLSAHNAGIFVATSAGNSGPGLGTVGHMEPWVTTVAATTHSRLGFGFDAGVNDDAAPAAVQAFPAAPMSGGTPSSVLTTPLTAQVAVAPDFTTLVSGAPTTGCTAYPAGTFTGKIALLRRGTCGFIVKEANARAAGAVAVLIANTGTTAANSIDYSNVSIGGPPPGELPTFSISFPNGDALRTYILANPTATLTIDPTSSKPMLGFEDVMASFSSRGPTTNQILKPDIAAPGVSILAATSGDAANVGLLQGTSMASPHIAGAGALLKQLKPTWTPMEIKSALATTAFRNVIQDTLASLANPLDRGSGRAQVAIARNVGLVMDESGFNFLAANPATNGKPTTLNLPTLSNSSCIVSCTFSRKFRNVTGASQTYNVTFNGFNAAIVATATPSSFTVAPGQVYTVDFTFNVSGVTPNTFQFGNVFLTPTNTALPQQHLTTVLSVNGSQLAVSPTSLSATAAAGASTTAPLNIQNTGNGTVAWEVLASTGTLTNVTSLAQVNNGANGFASDFYNALGKGEYSAEDFIVSGPTTLKTIKAEGFMNFGGTADFTNVSFSIYADDGTNTRPNGAPENFGTAPLYTATLAANAPGVTFPTPFQSIQINLATAGLTVPVLQPGRYWLVVWPSIKGDGSNNTANPVWNWFQANNPGNAAGVSIDMTAASPAWGASATSFATTITADIACGASWLSASPTTGTTPATGSLPTTVTFNAAALTAGTYQANICVRRTDASSQVAVVPVTFTVN